MIVCSGGLTLPPGWPITRSAGIHFTHNNAAAGKKWLPETMGSGVAFIDYDNDGYQDILLVNGEDWPGQKKRGTTLALYHNNHDGTFTDLESPPGKRSLEPGWACRGITGEMNSRPRERCGRR